MRSDHRHLTAYQIGGQRRQSIILILPPAVFDRQILALDETGFTQTLAECGISMVRCGGRPGVENPTTCIAGCCARARAAKLARRRAG